MSASRERSRARQSGTRTIRTARVPVPAGILANRDEVVPANVLSARLGWLAAIVQHAAEQRIVSVWDSQRVTDINDSRTSHAYVAMETSYGKGDWPPADLHASDRVRRLADEVAGRTLRSAARQMTLLTAILPVFLPEDVFAALAPKEQEAQSARLAAAWPHGTTGVERRNLRRSLRKFECREHRLPTNPYELRHCPTFADGFFTCPLDAADDQQVRLDGTSLSLLLPLCAKPTRRDWAWHVLPLALPSWTTRKYPDAPLCRPALRVTPRATYFLVPLDLPVPETRVGNRVLGCDWGVRRLLTGAVVTPDGEGAFTSGRPFFFAATGMQGKLYRVRGGAEILAAKITQIERLLAGRPDPALATRCATLIYEKDCLWRRLSAANAQLAHAAAKWTVATALAENCATIAVEGLADLEARTLGRTLNGRISLQVRGMWLDRLTEKAQLAGIRVVTVAARGTSSRCSRCGRPSVFWHAPDRRTGPGGRTHANWLVCACDRSSDRDHASAEAVGARGLDALLAAPVAPPRPSRRRPVPGPASYRKIRVQREPRRRCQRLPLAPQYMIPSRPCDEAAPRCVGRGSAVVPVTGQAELVPLWLVASSELQRDQRVLDGLCGGYRRRVRLSRVRALAPPPETQLNSSS